MLYYKELIKLREKYRRGKNRDKNYIVNIRSITSLRCCDINKVELILKPQPAEKVFISQLRIYHFKEWIEMENAVLPE